MKQGSKEWLQLRKTKITATDAPIIMGESSRKNALTLYHEKIDPNFETPKNFRMERGIELEPLATLSFISYTGIIIVPSVVVNDWAMASLDGISACGKVVEIKCPGNRDHDLAKKGKIPRYYIGQLQHQMWVCNVKSMFYFSYDGEDGIIISVKRDDFYIDLMIQQEKIFYQCLIERNEEKIRELF